VPQLGALRNTINTTTGPALTTLSGIADDVSGAIGSIADAVRGAIRWLGDLASKIASIKIPDWLEGHSPPPMANWFSDIGAAARLAARMDLPAFGSGLSGAGLTARAAIAGGDAGLGLGARSSVSNSTTDARIITYAPVYNDIANAPATDALLARSLAGV